jgi:hypothetical protein
MFISFYNLNLYYNIISNKMDTKNPYIGNIKDTDMKEETQGHSNKPERTIDNSKTANSETKPKKRNRLDEVPAHMRDLFYSKSHLLPTIIMGTEFPSCCRSSFTQSSIL